MKHHLVPTLLLGAALATVGCEPSPEPAPAPPTASSSGSPATSASAHGASPKIVAVEPVFEFGKVKLGAKVEHVFKIRNEGTAPLVIERARGS